MPNSTKRIIISFFTILILSGIGWYFLKDNLNPKSNNSISLEPQTESVAPILNDREIPSPPLDLPIPSPTTNRDITKSETVGILLLGYGGAGHQGGYLTDVMELIYYQKKSNKLAIIHIPRDVWVSMDINGKTLEGKINSFLALGTKTGNYPGKDAGKDAILNGASLAKLAVNNITSLPIDRVVGIDFDRFKSLIDSLGGVEVNVPRLLDDPWYPVRGRELELCGLPNETIAAVNATMSGFTLEKQFPCRYEHLVFNPGVNKLTGDQALKFARSRHSSNYGGDFARGERQALIVKGVKEKLFSLGALSKLPQFFSSLSKLVKSDLDLKAVEALAPALLPLTNAQISEIHLSTENVLVSSTAKNGAYILLPKDNDSSAIAKYINAALGK